MKGDLSPSVGFRGLKSYASSVKFSKKKKFLINMHKSWCPSFMGMVPWLLGTIRNFPHLVETQKDNCE